MRLHSHGWLTVHLMDFVVVLRDLSKNVDPSQTETFLIQKSYSHGNLVIPHEV